MNKEDSEDLIIVKKFKDGKTQNWINIPLIYKLQNKEDTTTWADVQLAYYLKTIIDDFGVILVNNSNNTVNKEQFEAALMQNLNDLLSQKTKVN
jgi:hypothetical protein